MAERVVRRLSSADFPELMRMEEQVFGACGEDVLGAYYVRLCCEFLNETSFVAIEGGKVVGYVLCFVRAREAYCTTLAVVPELQGSRATIQLLRALIGALVGRVDSCWFTVKEDNVAARALHSALGAAEVELREDYYGPGDRRIVSRIDRRGFARMERRLQRLGLLEPVPEASAA